MSTHPKGRIITYLCIVAAYCPDKPKPTKSDLPPVEILSNILEKQAQSQQILQPSKS